MNLKANLQFQYVSAFEMLRPAVVKCSEPVWNAPAQAKKWGNNKRVTGGIKTGWNLKSK